MPTQQATLPQLEAALRHDEFIFYYQPKVSFLSGEVTGAEALIRWRTPDGSLVEPNDFIPIAESSGLITAITPHMFPHLLADLERITEVAEQSRIAFNVSALDLAVDILPTLMDSAAHSGQVNISNLDIEVTEASAVANEAMIKQNLKRIMNTGIGISMDDYGTGYSSLQTLDNLPFSTLKVDQSFVMKLFASPKSATLVKASIAMAQMLGLKTVIEGIASENIYTAMLHCGGVEGQGYWISRPLPLADFLQLLRSRCHWPASPVGMLRMAQLGHIWQFNMIKDMAFSYVHDRTFEAALVESMHMSVTECLLGEWYYGLGQRFAADRDFQRLEEPHRRMHEMCGRLCDALMAGAENRQIAGMLRQLSDDSTKVFNSLQHLENMVLMQELH
jgi:EAL domain-containing protein (putative c-di-GMP-specific phosphodiesterase class I)